MANPVVQQVAGVLQGAGFNANAIAGILGNAYGESSWNPAAMEPHTHNGGLWGFTASPVSLNDVQAFARSRGRPWTDPVVQTQFLLQHIGGLRGSLNAARSPAEAATIFMNQFERPGVPRLDVRINGANQAFGMINGKHFGLPGPTSTSKAGGVSLPSTKTVTTGGGTDTTGAIISALLSSSSGTKVDNGSKLLNDMMSNLSSGAFTTPTTTSTVATPMSRSGAAPTSLGPAPPARNVAHLLSLAQAASGGPYSVANHAAALYWASAGQLKSRGTDCSGFVSWLMGPHGLGIWSSPYATPGIPHAPGMVPGKGQQITIFNSPGSGPSGHVFIEIAGHFFESAGSTGIHPMGQSQVQYYLAHGDHGLPYSPFHPKGY